MFKNRLIASALAVMMVPTLVGASEFLNDVDLGHVDLAAKSFTAAKAGDVLEGILLSHYELAGDMQFVRSHADKAGVTHLRFEQTINGLPVVGSDVYMHVDAFGKVLFINGDFAQNDVRAEKASLDAEQALTSALTRAKIVPNAIGDAELTYVLDKAGDARLAYSMAVEYTNFEGPQLDIVFADAHNGRMITRHPQHKYARSLATYDCNNGTSCGSLISSSSNTINTGDAAADAAHNYAIATYDYYLANHGRDSIDDNGMTLVSRVHYGSNYNNAFWNGSQMTYGDGDGVVFIPLSQDADVVAHELTHGVTERTSNLVYQDEPGALNEAMSDIFGAMVDRQEGANRTDTWLLGEDIYTPGTPGDGLRVMDDPEAAGDYDYYPTRYTGNSDNGGVHWNSGIANLAFVLLVEGGTHPRGKTSVVVPGIGFDAAADIFYAANTNCLTRNSNFEAARNCTVAAAGSNAAAVDLAWDAVGVPGGGGGPTCGAVGASCSSNSDCCSNRCRGRRGTKTCR